MYWKGKIVLEFPDYLVDAGRSLSRIELHLPYLISKGKKVEREDESGRGLVYDFSFLTFFPFVI